MICSSGSRLSGILLEPLLLSRDIVRCCVVFSLLGIRWIMRLCMDEMLVVSKSELRNDRVLPRLALSADIS